MVRRKGETNHSRIGIFLLSNNKKRGGLFCAAASFHHISILDLLLELGWNVNDTDEKGNNALVYAFRREEECFETVKYLIEKGIHINCSESEKMDALMQAMRFNRLMVGEILYRHGADINIEYVLEKKYGIMVQLDFLQKEEQGKWV